MNAATDTSEALSAPATATAHTRPFYWSVRRELWENRSLYIAPMVAAGVVLAAMIIASLHMPGEVEAPGPDQLRKVVAGVFLGIAMLILATTALTAAFYSLDALHSERRDRSILFWKSMPVSDWTAVLAKASIPLVIVPILIFVITIAMHCMMLVLSSAVVMVSGQNVAMLWNSLPLSRMWLLLLYHLVTGHALWPFPIYCWLLLVSGWATRATFLWAALPVVTIAGIEGIIFHTAGFAGLIGRRLFGDAPAMSMAPDSMGLDPMTTHVTIGRLLSSPGLWIGFATAAIFLAAAVRLRRYRAPI